MDMGSLTRDDRGVIAEVWLKAKIDSAEGAGPSDLPNTD